MLFIRLSDQNMRCPFVWLIPILKVCTMSNDEIDDTGTTATTLGSVNRRAIADILSRILK